MAAVTDIIRRRGALTTLLGANCVIFLIVAVLTIAAKLGTTGAAGVASWLELPGSFSVWLRRPWTLLTYMVTQRDFLHLLFNMLWLLWFGAILRETLTDRHLLGIYIGGGLSGGLLYMAAGAWLPALCPPYSALIGSSAAVMAIMTATAFRSPDYTFHLFFLGDVKLKWMALAMILLAFAGLGGGNSGGQVAHLGGVLFGAVQGMLLRRGADIFTPRTSARGGRRTGPDIPARRRRNVISVMERHRLDSERLDQLLDKIRISGFNSLSRSEREELQRLSQKVTK